MLKRDLEKRVAELEGAVEHYKHVISLKHAALRIQRDDLRALRDALEDAECQLDSKWAPAYIGFSIGVMFGVVATVILRSMLWV